MSIDKNHLEDLIANGKLEDVIRILRTYLKGKDRSLLEEVIGLNERLVNIKRDDRLNLVSYGQVKRERAKITQGLLGVIGEIGGDDLPPPPPVDSKTILLMGACPRNMDNIAFPSEFNKIAAKAERKGNRTKLIIQEQILAVSHDEFLRGIVEHKSQVVHFSGHGRNNGIWLVGYKENRELLSIEDQIDIYDQHKRIEFLFLNACDTEEQASIIARRIPFVLGMAGKISDVIFTNFSPNFYQALGMGLNYLDAYNYAMVSSDLKKSEEDHIPVLFKDGEKIKHKSIGKEVVRKALEDKKDNLD